MLYLKLRKEKGRRPPLYIPLTGLVSLSPQLVFFNSLSPARQSIAPGVLKPQQAS